MVALAENLDYKRALAVEKVHPAAPLTLTDIDLTAESGHSALFHDVIEAVEVRGVGEDQRKEAGGASWPGTRSADRNCPVIRLDPTPNPNAVKFSVGTPVGGPATFVAGQPTDNPIASAILELEGVTSIFMTADFITISKSSEGDWGVIVPEARAILEEHYG